MKNAGSKYAVRFASTRMPCSAAISVLMRLPGFLLVVKGDLSRACIQTGMGAPDCLTCAGRRDCCAIPREVRGPREMPVVRLPAGCAVMAVWWCPRLLNGSDTSILALEGRRQVPDDAHASTTFDTATEMAELIRSCTDSPNAWKPWRLTWLCCDAQGSHRHRRVRHLIWH